MTDTSSWTTSLPQSLQNPDDLSKLKMCVTQWSRLVSWSWTRILAFKNDREKAEQEKTLKTFFNKFLQKQGQNTYAYESYADLSSKDDADTLSSILYSLFLGEHESISSSNIAIADLDIANLKNVKVTLSQVLNKLSREDFVLTKYPEFASMFTFRAIVDYTGKIIEIDERKYIALLAYPPRPVLSDFTVTKTQLKDWARNIDTGGNYLPPSIYIPIAST